MNDKDYIPRKDYEDLQGEYAKQRRLAEERDRIIKVLAAAGHITNEQVDQARAIVRSLEAK